MGGLGIVEQQRDAIDKQVAQKWAEQALNETNVKVLDNGDRIKLSNGTVIDVPKPENMSVDISINMTGEVVG